jgi:kynurenine 3-monooxygenase
LAGTTKHGKADVTIVGAGLVGSLLATFLVRRKLDVEVWERRADPRQAGAAGGRSINLVVTSRGINALRQVGLDRAASRLTVPVTGRMMHTVDAELSYQPYGRDDSECNYSISRSELNRLLIDEAEKRGVRFRFGKRLADADFHAGQLAFIDESSGEIERMEADCVFGADGGGSAVRTVMQDLEGYHEAIEPLGHAYRELLIPASDDGSYRIEKNALHIWPRGQLMLMALPNTDGSFTVTIYLPESGASSFRELETAEKVSELFERQFPDAIPLIPDLTESFLSNPPGNLGTVRCHPWHVGGRALLIGDAAHGIVPFFGQGMNCGFEDCIVLERLIDEHGSWDAVFPEFTKQRKVHADAIADMALENFIEMRDLVGDARFSLRKQVEQRLERNWPHEYRSRYSLIMYGDVAYRVAQEAGRIQQEILDELCDGLGQADDLDETRARSLIGRKLRPFLERHAVDLSY